MLNDFLDYCESLDTDVIFTLSPTYMSDSRMAQANTAVDICESRGFTVLDFTKEPLRSAIDFDFNKDFYNPRHVSYTGGLKYTEYMMDYLTEHYDMVDHRGDPAYESWDVSIEDLSEYVNESR